MSSSGVLRMRCTSRARRALKGGGTRCGWAPFTSTGGYDWWQLAGRDAGDLGEAVAAHGTVFIVESLVGAVDAQGVPLVYPPVHLHHVHVNPENEALRYQYLLAPYMYFNNLVIERHGEWNWQSGGVLSEAEAAGYGRQISFPLDLDSELNDVRPGGSAPLEWFLQFALRWRPGAAGLRPVRHAHRAFAPCVFARASRTFANLSSSTCGMPRALDR